LIIEIFHARIRLPNLVSVEIKFASLALPTAVLGRDAYIPLIRVVKNAKNLPLLSHGRTSTPRCGLILSDAGTFSNLPLFRNQGRVTIRTKFDELIHRAGKAHKIPIGPVIFQTARLKQHASLRFALSEYERSPEVSYNLRALTLDQLSLVLPILSRRASSTRSGLSAWR
jgi:hypothetical protein